MTIILRGGISTERSKTYILSYTLALFCSYRVNVRLKLRGGISQERPKMNILSYKRPPFGES